MPMIRAPIGSLGIPGHNASSTQQPPTSTSATASAPILTASTTASILTITAANPSVLPPSTIHTPFISGKTSAATTTTAPITSVFDRNASATLSTSTLTSSTVNSVPTCPHRDRGFTSCIGVSGRLRTHYTATARPVSASSTCT
nr:unnamed protein product [Spirometra erinaceieuropaei]